MSYYVKLVAVSQPVNTEVCSSPEQLLAYCARVSSTANQVNHETGSKLIKSLVKRKEWSPLEMVSATMEIGTTRDIGRQILRHRSFSFQEYSQRYAVAGEDGPAIREARDQHPTDRQMSVELGDQRKSAQADWVAAQEQVWDFAMQRYKAALSRGMAKEVARCLLPEGLTPTKMYMAGTLRSWYHYCHLRMDPKTQKEHRLIAETCWGLLVKQFPSLEELEGHQN